MWGHLPCRYQSSSRTEEDYRSALSNVYGCPLFGLPGAPAFALILPWCPLTQNYPSLLQLQPDNPFLLERHSVTWKKLPKRSCSHPDGWQRAGISLGFIPRGLLCSAEDNGLPGLWGVMVIVVVSNSDCLWENKFLKMFWSWKDMLMARPSHTSPMQLVIFLWKHFTVFRRSVSSSKMHLQLPVQTPHWCKRAHSSAEINGTPSPYLSGKLILLLPFHLISSAQRNEWYCQHLKEKACLVFRATQHREREEIIFTFSFIQGVEVPWLHC